MDAPPRNQVALGERLGIEGRHGESLRFTRVAPHKVALAFGVIGRAVEQEQTVSPRSDAHLNLETCPRLRKDNRHILHIARERHIFGRGNHAVHPRRGVRVAIVEFQRGQGCERLGVNQVINRGRYAAEHDNRRLLLADGHQDVNRVVLCALNPLVRSELNRARVGVEFVGVDFELAAEVVGGNRWDADEVEIRLLARHGTAVIHNLEHIAPHAHHGLHPVAHHHNRAVHRGVRVETAVRVEQVHIAIEPAEASLAGGCVAIPTASQSGSAARSRPAGSGR
ncbi:MAG: hypothetical protein KatS3mg016_1527 [Fimbriimonadales bacterium]|nr:MAG: hypothetical protein KatS3mg016_1527 [Fimbriimonadales bacterium]